MPRELAKRSHGAITAPAAGTILPAVIADAGEKAGKRFIEFLTATIRNGNTRQAYARAIGDFFAWCERHRLTLSGIEPQSSGDTIPNSWAPVVRPSYQLFRRAS